MSDVEVGPSMRLEGKVALVTGGGTGIGAAVARQLGAAGARVVVTGRRPGPLQAVAEEIDGLAVPADATRGEDVRAMLAATVERFAGVDIVVANAGGQGFESALDTDDAAWAAAWEDNVTSAFLVIREALPWLIARRGTIVVVSSLAGAFAGPHALCYTTAKHALIGLTRSLARDYGRDGVRANAVCPGWVATSRADAAMDHLGELAGGIDREAAYRLATGDVPLGRAVSAGEIASICAFLASPSSAAITGAVIMADGGASIVDVPTLAFERAAARH